MPEVSISGVDLFEQPIQAHNCLIVARFKVQYGDVTLIGVNLGQTPDGGFRCWLPTDSTRSHRVVLQPPARDAIISAAVAALRALGAPAVPPSAKAIRTAEPWNELT